MLTEEQFKEAVKFIEAPYLSKSTYADYVAYTKPEPKLKYTVGAKVMVKGNDVGVVVEANDTFRYYPYSVSTKAGYHWAAEEELSPVPPYLDYEIGQVVEMDVCHIDKDRAGAGRVKARVVGIRKPRIGDWIISREQNQILYLDSQGFLLDRLRTIVEIVPEWQPPEGELIRWDGTDGNGRKLDNDPQVATVEEVKDGTIHKLPYKIRLADDDFWFCNISALRKPTDEEIAVYYDKKYTTELSNGTLVRAYDVNSVILLKWVNTDGIQYSEYNSVNNLFRELLTHAGIPVMPFAKSKGSYPHPKARK